MTMTKFIPGGDDPVYPLIQNSDGSWRCTPFDMWVCLNCGRTIKAPQVRAYEPNTICCDYTLMVKIAINKSQ